MPKKIIPPQEPTETPFNPGIGDRPQTVVAAKLQGLWLGYMERALENGTITSTDLATLARVLLANGWALDPARLPTSLKDKITKDIAFDGDDNTPRIRLAK